TAPARGAAPPRPGPADEGDRGRARHLAPHREQPRARDPPRLRRRLAHGRAPPRAPAPPHLARRPPPRDHPPVEAQRPGAARLAAWLGGDIDEALEGVGLPAWLVDRRGIVRWQNIRASELFGDFVGRPAWEGFAADSQEIAQREFT